MAEMRFTHNTASARARATPAHDSRRCCRRCGGRIQWGGVRFVGWRRFCGEVCATLWLSDAADRTAWNRTVLQIDPRSHRLWRRVRLAWAARRAKAAQRRLDRRLGAGPHAENLPWIWLPSPRSAAALTLALVAWGISGNSVPATRGIGPAPNPVTPLTAIPAEADRSPLLALPPTEMPTPARPSPERGRARPALHRTAQDIVRGDLTTPEIAFTFDGGDDANVAGEILDSLRARTVRSTMFLTGQFIRKHPDIVRRMVAEGHEIGNHLDTHPHLTTYAQDRRQQALPTVTREFLLGQLHRAEESFRGLTGQAMAPFWRAPFGEHSVEIRAWAAEAGYRHVSWTRGAGTAEDLDTRDWVADRSSRSYRSREEIAARILEFGNGRPEGLNGGIVLMHLATHRRIDQPHEILPDVLRALQAQGYRLVTISQLLRRFRTDQEPPSPTPSPPAADREASTQ
jgi:peptidoglycan/xylan/chitin deacetylase (PgdA/CDA1 family)